MKAIEQQIHVSFKADNTKNKGGLVKVFDRNTKIVSIQLHMQREGRVLMRGPKKQM